MASFIQKMSIALLVSLAICSASPARLDKLRPNKSKFLARQEVISEDIPAQTPYPPAGIQPEVKFALPTEEKLDEPEKTYLPPAGEPAKTYGPPEASVKDEVEEVANDESEIQETQSAEPKLENPDAEELPSEQPEDSDEEEPEPQDSAIEPAGIEAEEIEAEAVKNEEDLKNQLPARLVLATRGNNKQKSAKLQVAHPQQIVQQSANLQVATPQILQPVYYFNYNGQLFRLLN